MAFCKARRRSSSNWSRSLTTGSDGGGGAEADGVGLGGTGAAGSPSRISGEISGLAAADWAGGGLIVLGVLAGEVGGALEGRARAAEPAGEGSPEFPERPAVP